MTTDEDFYDEDVFDDEHAKRIKEWPKDFNALMAFVKNSWWAADWGWNEAKSEEGMKYNISTGGHSDNEYLIGLLQDNYMFWALCWEQSRRGGHYIFEVREGL